MLTLSPKQLRSEECRITRTAARTVPCARQHGSSQVHMRDVYATTSVASRIGRAHRNTTVTLSASPAPQNPHTPQRLCAPQGPHAFRQCARPNTCSYVALFSGDLRGTHFLGSPTGGCLRGVVVAAFGPERSCGREGHPKNGCPSAMTLLLRFTSLPFFFRAEGIREMVGNVVGIVVVPWREPGAPGFPPESPPGFLSGFPSWVPSWVPFWVPS